MLGFLKQIERVFSQQSLCSVCCCAVRMSHNNCEIAVDGFNLALFWVDVLKVNFHVVPFVNKR